MTTEVTDCATRHRDDSDGVNDVKFAGSATDSRRCIGGRVANCRTLRDKLQPVRADLDVHGNL